MEAAPTVTAAAAAAPETMRSSDAPEQFSVEEFFDFSNEEDDELLFSDNVVDTTEFKSFVAESSSSVTLLVDNSCNSSLGGDLGISSLTSELCVPYDDPAELEWVSAFAEESFSSEDMEKLQLISGMSARPEDTISAAHEPRTDPNTTKSPPEIPVPGKARSKRARTSSGNWTSPLLLASSASESKPDPNPNPIKKRKTVRKYGPDYLTVAGRKCQHCQTDKTPQWRTGPNGPKTLCNACGVRYKTGRLVPEYRPASSPTFVHTKHSNSHRKVLELRRQKEMKMMMGTHQPHQRYVEQYRNVWMDGSNGEDYLIHRRIEPDFGQLI